jgi:hypothetical protein
MASDDDLLGWTPTRWLEGPTGPSIEWRQLGRLRLADPFFEDTVRKALGDRERGLPRKHTTVQRLGEFSEALPGIRPNGFIFHLSRCGSTLVSQMLAAVPTTILVSEAPPIDAILRAPVGDEERVRWLRWMIGALGQRRLGTEQALYVKVDSWHMPELPLFRRAFPDVPWIFVYREPLEVLVSHAQRRGMHMVPGLIDTSRLGVDPGIFPGVSLDAYGSHVLAAICEAALRGYAGGGGRLVNYRELPAWVEEELAPWFGLDLSATDREAMHRAAMFRAKRPGEPFRSDSADKVRRATPALRVLAETIVGGVYLRLEAARGGGIVATKPAPSPPIGVQAAALPSSLKLPIAIDIQGLRADLSRVAPTEFVPHFNGGYYEGDWSAVALRSTDGSSSQIYPDPVKKDAYTDTALLARCDHVRELLATLLCPVRAVRFLRLGPTSSIKEHADLDLGIELGEVRLHIPITSNPQVEFVVGGARVEMGEGECWYHDFSLRHRVENKGATARTHLVVDCVVSDWLRQLLLRAASGGGQTEAGTRS